MATEKQIAAAINALRDNYETQVLGALVRVVVDSLEESATEASVETAKPCQEILAALQEAQQLLGEIGDSLDRRVGITLSRRALGVENRCRAAAKSLRALIEES